MGLNGIERDIYDQLNVMGDMTNNMIFAGVWK